MCAGNISSILVCDLGQLGNDFYVHVRITNSVDFIVEKYQLARFSPIN